MRSHTQAVITVTIQKKRVKDQFLRPANGIIGVKQGCRHLFQQKSTELFLLEENCTHLDVSWYIISKRSSFGSNVFCIVVHPTTKGSKRPTSRVLISTLCFCLGFGSLVHAKRSRSFKAPTRAASVIRESFVRVI